MILIFFCIIAANSSLTFYGPTLVKEVGFTSPRGGRLDHGRGLPLRRRRHDLQRLPFRPAPGDRASTAAWRPRSAPASLLVIALLPEDQRRCSTLVALTLAIVGTMSAIPVFWQMPNRFLSGTAAAGGVALINSIANLAGFGAPWMLGRHQDRDRAVCAPGLLRRRRGRGLRDAADPEVRARASARQPVGGQGSPLNRPRP